ncbi:MAG: hypothetical protein H8D54_03855, partial [Candidatus Omnitrophica bacterium]|nr:hypothetical protein [Candidatus Omnitrophota bacterium]
MLEDLSCEFRESGLSGIYIGIIIDSIAGLSDIREMALKLQAAKDKIVSLLPLIEGNATIYHDYTDIIFSIILHLANLDSPFDFNSFLQRYFYKRKAIDNILPFIPFMQSIIIYSVLNELFEFSQYYQAGYSFIRPFTMDSVGRLTGIFNGLEMDDLYFGMQEYIKWLIFWQYATTDSSFEEIEEASVGKIDELRMRMETSNPLTVGLEIGLPVPEDLSEYDLEELRLDAPFFSQMNEEKAKEYLDRRVILLAVAFNFFMQLKPGVTHGVRPSEIDHTGTMDLRCLPADSQTMVEMLELMIPLFMPYELVRSTRATTVLDTPKSEDVSFLSALGFYLDRIGMVGSFTDIGEVVYVRDLLEDSLQGESGSVTYPGVTTWQAASERSRTVERDGGVTSEYQQVTYNYNLLAIGMSVESDNGEVGEAWIFPHREDYPRIVDLHLLALRDPEGFKAIVLEPVLHFLNYRLDLDIERFKSRLSLDKAALEAAEEIRRAIISVTGGDFDKARDFIIELQDLMDRSIIRKVREKLDYYRKNIDPSRALPDVPLSEGKEEQDRIASMWNSLETVDFEVVINTVNPVALKLARLLFGKRFQEFIDYIKEEGLIRAGPSDKIYGSFLPEKGLFLNIDYLNDPRELTRTLLHEFGAYLGLPDWFNKYILENLTQPLVLMLTVAGILGVTAIIGLGLAPYHFTFRGWWGVSLLLGAAGVVLEGILFAKRERPKQPGRERKPQRPRRRERPQPIPLPQPEREPEPAERPTRREPVPVPLPLPQPVRNIVNWLRNPSLGLQSSMCTVTIAIAVIIGAVLVINGRLDYLGLVMLWTVLPSSIRGCRYIVDTEPDSPIFFIDLMPSSVFEEIVPAISTLDLDEQKRRVSIINGFYDTLAHLGISDEIHEVVPNIALSKDIEERAAMLESFASFLSKYHMPQDCIG